MQAAVGRSLEGTSPARGRGREAGNDGGKAGSGGCFVEEAGGRADQCPQTQAFSISLQRTGGGRSWQPYPESLWKVGQGREEAHPAVHIYQSSQVLVRWGHTSWGHSRPPESCSPGQALHPPPSTRQRSFSRHSQAGKGSVESPPLPGEEQENSVASHALYRWGN